MQLFSGLLKKAESTPHRHRNLRQVYLLATWVQTEGWSRRGWHAAFPYLCGLLWRGQGENGVELPREPALASYSHKCCQSDKL